MKSTLIITQLALAANAYFIPYPFFPHMSKTKDFRAGNILGAEDSKFIDDMNSTVTEE
jgi:hypothetical protein